MDGNQKIFTVEASKATDFRDKDASLLEDVKITIFGKKGERHDLIRTQSCQYEKEGDRKSTRLNSSHGYISYAVFCLKKKNTKIATSSRLVSMWMRFGLRARRLAMTNTTPIVRVVLVGFTR